jgi:hypothetical protein
VDIGDEIAEFFESRAILEKLWKCNDTKRYGINSKFNA